MTPSIISKECAILYLADATNVRDKRRREAVSLGEIAEADNLAPLGALETALKETLIPEGLAEELLRRTSRDGKKQAGVFYKLTSRGVELYEAMEARPRPYL